ncbi:MAG: hypothetical protein WC238_02670 [Parcubacteria group bacterium]|jgi:hypothetical protein
MSINYLDIIKKAWTITWHNKHLWWFGFFITLAGAGSSFNYRNSGSNEQAKVIGEQVSSFMSQHIGLMIFLMVILLVVFIVITVLSIISRGALIKSAHAITKNEITTFKSGFAHGQKYFWRILGLNLLLVLAAIIILFIILIPIVFLFISHSYILGTILALAGVALIIPLIILLVYLRVFGDLYVVLGDLAIKPALENAYALFLKNLGVSIIMGLLFIPLSIAVGLAALLAIFCLAIVFLIIGGIFYLLFSKIGAIIIAVIAAIFFIILFLAARSIYETFTQTAWVLFFHEIAKPKVEEKVTESAAEKIPNPVATPDPVTFTEK